jgi:hypothetical protein
MQQERALQALTYMHPNTDDMPELPLRRNVVIRHAGLGRMPSQHYDCACIILCRQNISLLNYASLTIGPQSYNNSWPNY